jgi:hypothetical protein
MSPVKGSIIGFGVAFSFALPVTEIFCQQVPSLAVQTNGNINLPQGQLTKLADEIGEMIGEPASALFLQREQPIPQDVKWLVRFIATSFSEAKRGRFNTREGERMIRWQDVEVHVSYDLTLRTAAGSRQLVKGLERVGRSQKSSVGGLGVPTYSFSNRPEEEMIRDALHEAIEQLTIGDFRFPIAEAIVIGKGHHRNDFVGKDDDAMKMPFRFFDPTTITATDSGAVVTLRLKNTLPLKVAGEFVLQSKSRSLTEIRRSGAMKAGFSISPGESASVQITVPTTAPLNEPREVVESLRKSAWIAVSQLSVREVKK